MTKIGHKTTSVDIENHLYALSIEEGLNLNAFVNLGLAIYHGVPEDPRQKLVKEKTKYTVLRLKEKYEREVKAIINDYAAQSSLREADQQKEADLILFGKYLQKSSNYPAFEMALMQKDIDENILESITREINSMNGRTYQPDELWNRAIDWYVKYGRAAV